MLGHKYKGHFKPFFVIVVVYDEQSWIIALIALQKKFIDTS